MLKLPRDYTGDITREDADKAATAALGGLRDGYGSGPGKDGWDGWAIVMATPDPDLTDDYLIDVSNLYRALADLQGVNEDDVDTGWFGHWTYSRYLSLSVRVVGKSGKRVTPVFVRWLELVNAMRDYLLLDESDYSEREWARNEEWLELAWRQGDLDDIKDKGCEDCISRAFMNAIDYCGDWPKDEYVLEQLAQEGGCSHAH